ncbi:hypothetical protein [Pedobacter aquatilis]|uniref:hypothetical protein n=1 Tax=Pedobacter aquatilis TaxID=351343 RepID=UPI00292E9C58|nr:hypothetical protein [Pedobacter aquatilis]
MSLKLNAKNVNLLSKFPWQSTLIILLSGVSLLFGIIIKNNADDKKYQIERIEYLRNYIKNIEGDRATWLSKESEKDALEIKRQQQLIDSLQKLLLTRTDKNFEELKNILDIKGRRSVITIKPKER